MTETESLTLTLTWHADKYKVHKLQRRHIVNKACPPVISATSTDTNAHSFPPLQQTQMHIHFRHFNRHKCTFISATSTDTNAHSFPPLQQTQMHIHFRHFNRHKCTFISATSTDTNAHSFPPLQLTQMQPLKLQEQLSKGHKSQQSRSACKYPSELSQSNRPVYIQCA